MKDCVVSIKGFQNYSDDKDCIEMKASGKFQYSCKKTVAVYYESQVKNNDVRVLLKYYDSGKLVIERSGALENTMCFEKGKRHCEAYANAQGKMWMGIYCESLYSDLNEIGGTISADYQLDVEGRIVSRNSIEITLKEV